jgi:hypothetical protein
MPAGSGRDDHCPRQAFLTAHAGWTTMTTPNTEITTITLRAKLEEAAAFARAAEGCAVDGQPERALMITLDVEPLAVEANGLLQGLATLSRVVHVGQD